MVLAGLVALPLSATAQLAEEGATPEPNLQEPALSDHSPGDEGGLSPRLRKRTQRNWDPSAYDVQGDPRPSIQYTSAPQKPTRPKLGPGIGLGISIASLVGGVAMMSVGVSQRFCISFGEPCDAPRSSGVLIGTGAALTVFGLLGTIVSGVAFRNSEGARAKAPSQRNARRVQWDLAQDIVCSHRCSEGRFRPC
jgi:hypothetical protein